MSSSSLNPVRSPNWESEIIAGRIQVDNADNAAIIIGREIGSVSQSGDTLTITWANRVRSVISIHLAVNNAELSPVYSTVSSTQLVIDLGATPTAARELSINVLVSRSSLPNV